MAGQIGRFVKTALFFVLLSVNIHLACIYLTPVSATREVSGMFLGVFLLQLLHSFLFILSDLWLHDNKIRMIAVVLLALAGLAGAGYLYGGNGKLVSYQNSFGMFWLALSGLFVYLLLAIRISYFIKRLSAAKANR
ncbi:MAG: hypothetical protein LIP00_04160 [Parabacteroides sp.]|nr:hypothetical protein [Parabacteroides sp.]